MQLKDKAGWDEYVKNNSDPYGSCAIRYVERWADLMEARLAGGETVEQCAKDTSHEADTEGITGYMYGCAVVILAAVWEHGEVLRRWHNLDAQIGDEGERANDSGSVLNPALINIG